MFNQILLLRDSTTSMMGTSFDIRAIYASWKETNDFACVHGNQSLPCHYTVLQCCWTDRYVLDIHGSTLDMILLSFWPGESKPQAGIKAGTSLSMGFREAQMSTPEC